MGFITLPSLDDITQQKDPKQQMEMLVNTVGLLMKSLTEINGYLTTKNIKELHADVIIAGTITADKMDVQELSAISADLGTINAGEINSVDIYGSYIATADGTYPRAEMSNTQNLFGAYSASDKYVQMKALDGPTSAPMLTLRDGSLSITGVIYIDGLTNEFNIGSVGKMQISAAPSDLMLNGGTVRVPSWDQVVNHATGQTLRDAILFGPT